jgi:ribulose-5-phosphate 4-epimerase/fuculose-1-phosphate aldolase
MADGSVAGVVSLKGKVSAEEWQARVDLAALYRLVALHGWDDLIYTHISARIPGPEHHFLINPYGMLFEEITASSLVKIDLDGNVVQETPYKVNPAGFVIHSAIHMGRKNAQCVMHTHTVAGMAISMQTQGLIFASQHACFFDGNIGYHSIEHMKDGVDGRDQLAADLGPHPALIMRNHGLLAVGRTVGETFWVMHTLEKACAAQLAATAGGMALHPVSAEGSGYFGTLLREADFSLKLGNTAWPPLLALLDSTDPSFRN